MASTRGSEDDRQPAPRRGSPAKAEESVPVRIGAYTIQKKIGAGGMGAVYLALDTRLNRTVALKVLPQEKAQNPTLVRRFKAEAQAAASLKHDNIVTVYEAGEADGHSFMALEFVDGTDIANLVQRRGTIPVKRSVEIIRQVASALQHAGEQGIAHRDIKPANLLIRRDGMVKLADMGLARSLDEAADTGITRAGTTVGTVDYMAPEQARDSKSADTRSDIYSLGCTWYHMLTGSPPFPEGSMLNKLRAHADQPMPDPRLKNPQVPEVVVAILSRMTAKDPKQRYQTAAQLLQDLQRTNFSRDALSESVLSELAKEETEQSSGGSSGGREGNARAKSMPPLQPLHEENAQEQRDYSAILYTVVALLLVGAVVGVGIIVNNYSNSIDVPIASASANPFTPDFNDNPRGNGTSNGPDTHRVDPSDDAAAANQAQRPSTTGQAPPTVHVEPRGPSQTPSETGPGAAVARPAWASTPRGPEGLPQLTVDPSAAPRDRQYTNLNEALAHVPASGAVINLVGDGPFSLRPARLESRTRVVIQNGRTRAPQAGSATASAPLLIVLLAGTETTQQSFLEATGTAVELHGVHLALDSEELLKAPQISTLLHVTSGPLLLRESSISLKGSPNRPLTAIHMDGQSVSGGAGPVPTQLILEDSVIRGQQVTSLLLDLEHAQVFAGNSLLWSTQAPLLRLQNSTSQAPGTSSAASSSPPSGTNESPGPDKPAGGASSGAHQLQFARTTFCSTTTAIELAELGTRPRPVQFAFDNSIVTTPTADSPTTLFALVGWTRAEARGALGRSLTWNTQDSLYLGWKALVKIEPEGLVAATTADQWQQQVWKDRSAGQARDFSTQTWPAPALPDANDLTPFTPQRLPASVTSALSGSHRPGCPVDRLPVARLEGLQVVADLAARPRWPQEIADRASSPRTLRVDLNREDLGRFLATQQLPPGTLIIASGFGARTTTPIHIKDTRVRLQFEQGDGYPLVLTPRSIDTTKPHGEGVDDALISVARGSLELVNVTLGITSSEKQPIVPRWLLQVIDGDVSLQNCRLQGPMVAAGRNKGLIQWLRSDNGGPAAANRLFAGSYSAQAAIDNSYLCSVGTLLEADLRHRGLFLRNTVAVSRDDLFALPLSGTDPRIDGAILLDHCTLSAAANFFRIPGAELTGPATAPLAIHVDRTVFAPPISTGLQSPTPTLLAHGERLLSQGQLSWREDHAGYAPEIRHFLRPAEVSPGAPQDFEAVWKKQWGQRSVLNPLVGVGGVLLADQLPARHKLEPDDFKLHRTARAANWDNGAAIGADIEKINVPNFQAPPSGIKTKPKVTKPAGF